MRILRAPRASADPVWRESLGILRPALPEAEPLLLEGYRGMKEREATIPPQGHVRILKALERLVQFYEATRNEAEAAAWRAKSEAARAEQTRATAKGRSR